MPAVLLRRPMARRAGLPLAAVLLALLLAACVGSDGGAPPQAAPGDSGSAEQAPDATPPADAPDAAEPDAAREDAVRPGGADSEPESGTDDADVDVPDVNAPVDAAALLARLFVGDLAGLRDYRFTGTLDLRLAAEDADDHRFDLLTALGGVRFQGVVVPPDSFELTIEFGCSGAGGLPPFGLAQVGEALFTRFGFGWLEQSLNADSNDLFAVLFEADALLAVVLAAPGALGFDFVPILDAIREPGGLLSGAPLSGGVFPTDVLNAALIPAGPAAIDGRPVQRYQIDRDGLESIVGAVLDPGGFAERIGTGTITGSIDAAAIELFVTEADGLLLRVVADLENPRVDVAPAGEGETASTGPVLPSFQIPRVHVELEMDPELGVPVRLLIDIPEFAIASDAPYGGSMHLEIVVDAINTGGVPWSRRYKFRPADCQPVDCRPVCSR